MKKYVVIVTILIVISLTVFLLYYNYFASSLKFKYLNTYKSEIDKDLDGIDDQTDILESVKKYLDKKPKYKSKYYGSRIS